MATPRSTNFYGRHGNSSPAAGAYVVIPVCFDAVAANGTRTKTVDLPPGMKLRVSAITVQASAIAGSGGPTVSVGSAATVAKYAAATEVTTNLGALTLVSANQQTGDGERIAVQAITDADDTATDLVVTIFGFVTAHPTAAPGR